MVLMLLLSVVFLCFHFFYGVTTVINVILLLVCLKKKLRSKFENSHTNIIKNDFFFSFQIFRFVSCLIFIYA